jgi:hypothetical protein
MPLGIKRKKERRKMLEYFKWVKAHKNDPIVYGPVLGIAFLIVVVLGYLFV